MWKTILPVLLAILYSLSPYDVLPDFILGWGWVDDAIVLWFLWQYLKKIKERSTWPNSESRGGQAHRGRNQSDADNGRQQAPRDAHAILGVGRNASQEEIKQAYRHLANQYHPDKVAHLGEEFRVLAEKRFKEIQEAYHELIPRAK